MKTRFSPVWVLLFAGSALTRAFAAGGPAAAPAAGNPAMSATPEAAQPVSLAAPEGTSSTDNSSAWAVAERMLNNDNLSIDTENGIFQWKNTKFDIGNNLLVRSRFERYLSSPGYGDTTADYQQILQQIQDLLSVDDNSPDKGDKVYEAWQLLFQAAKFDQDGGASMTLANQVYDAWRVRDELFQNNNQYNGLEDQRKQQQDGLVSDVQVAQDIATRKAEDAGTHSTPVASGRARGTGGGGGGNNGGGGGGGSGGSGNSSSSGSGSATTNGISLSGSGIPSGSGDSSSSVDPVGSAASGIAAMPSFGSVSQTGFGGMELARTFAKETLLDAQTTQLGVQSKLQYQTQLFTYILERRFQHSLMAGQFYEHIFKGSQQRINVGQKQMSQFISIDNVVPSVNTFEFISHEAMSDVDTSMKAVDTAYSAGQHWLALQQLQQAFLLGEMLPSVQGFDPAKRQVLLTLYHDSTDLKHLMDGHDFAGAEQTLQKITAEAPDFDSAPIYSAINEGKQASNLALLNAEQAAMSNDGDRFQQALKEASELWPLNPEIDSFAKSLRDKSSLIGQGVPKFDELLARKDDRQIYDLRTELGLALYQDPDRSAKLKDIVERVSQVDVLITLADQAVKQNNGYAGWEALASAAKIEPDDPELNRAQANLAPQVANFVSALDQASHADQNGDYAASLNYYLVAQDIYPASELCHDGIDSVGKKLMAKLNPNGPSAHALAAEEAASSAAASTDGTSGTDASSTPASPAAPSTPATPATPAAPAPAAPPPATSASNSSGTNSGSLF